MSVHGGANLDTTGLTLWLDASRTDCYSGTGTDVYNLAPYPYNGTILSLGSGTVHNAAGGYWDFDQFGGIAFGVSQISTDPSAFLTGISGELTYEIWHYPINIVQNYRLMSTDRSDYNCFMWGNTSNTNATLEFSYDDAQFPVSGWSTGKWWHIVGTGSRQNSEVCIYRNGVRVYNTTYAAANPIGVGSARPFAVNQNVEDTVDTDYGATGYTAMVRIYGKALTPAQVRQNFQAYKSRFGY